MEEATKLPVKVSKEFNLDIDQIYAWGIKTFGTRQAELYENEIQVLRIVHSRRSVTKIKTIRRIAL